jgi:DNA polymerase kappa
MTSAESPAKSAHPEENEDDDLKTLKYHLLGPSLTKAGQDKVDQSKVIAKDIVTVC